MGHIKVIAGTLTVIYGWVFSINFPESMKIQRNKKTSVTGRLFCRMFSCKFTLDTAFSMYISILLCKTCSGGIVFGEFNQILL